MFSEPLVPRCTLRNSRPPLLAVAPQLVDASATCHLVAVRPRDVASVRERPLLRRPPAGRSVRARAGSRATVAPDDAGAGIKPERRWRGPESNRRHHDFQSCALPTELPRRAGGMVAARAGPAACA